MPTQGIRRRVNVRRPEIITACLRHREDELLDAVVTAAALGARADGWVQPVERSQLLDFLDRKEFLSIFAREEILDAFERCVRRLREPGGLMAAVERLRRPATHLPVRLIIEVAEEVAAADCRLDPREERILELIRTALGRDASPLRAHQHAKDSAL
jgi:tellurium resistance protein TerD